MRSVLLVFTVYASSICRASTGKSRLSGDSNLDSSALLEAMRVAVSLNKVEALRTMLQHPEAKPDLASSLLFRDASRLGHHEVVELLIQDGRSRPNAEDSLALKDAAKGGYHQVVALLLADERGGVRADPGAQSNYAIRYAAQGGHLDVVRMLLGDGRVNPGDLESQALALAAEHGHVEVVRLLLGDDRVDPTDNDSKALRSAAKKNQLEVARLLLGDPRTDPRGDDNRPLKKAAERGHLEMAKLIIGRIGQPTEQENHVLYKAALSGHLETVRFLLTFPQIDCGFDDNAIFRQMTWHGQHSDVAKALLDHVPLEGQAAVDPTTRNNEAMRNVALYGHVKMLDLLLRDGRADAWIAYGSTHPKIVAYLDNLPYAVMQLELGAVKQADYTKWTRGQLEMLLERSRNSREANLYLHGLKHHFLGLRAETLRCELFQALIASRHFASFELLEKEIQGYLTCMKCVEGNLHEALPCYDILVHVLPYLQVSPGLARDFVTMYRQKQRATSSDKAEQSPTSPKPGSEASVGVEEPSKII